MSNPSVPPRAGSTFVRTLRESEPVKVTMTAASSTSFVLVAFIPEVWPALVIYGVLLIVIERFLAYKRSTKAAEFDFHLTELRKQLASAIAAEVVVRDTLDALVEEIAKSTQVGLMRIAKGSGLTSRDRISLYRVVDDALVLVARHSDDSEFKRMGSHHQELNYGPTHGLIGMAMRTQKRRKVAMGPDFSDDEGAYRAWQREQSLTLAPGDEPGMKSRSYDVVPVFDSESKDNVIGIVALESTRTRCAAMTAVGDLMSSEREIATGLVRELVRLGATAGSSRERGEA